MVALQRALLQAGISFSGGADGIFGSATAGAVMKFQRARGLRVTGKVDQATADALGLQPRPTPAPAPAVDVTLQAKPLAKGPCWYGDTWQAARGSGRVHLGVDIGAPEGTPLLAVASAGSPGLPRPSGFAVGQRSEDPNRRWHVLLLRPSGEHRPRYRRWCAGERRPDDRHDRQHRQRGHHPRPLRGAPCGGAAVNPFPYVRAIGAC